MLFSPKTHIIVESGISGSPFAASFVRVTRPCDDPLSFLDALKKKYVLGNSTYGSVRANERISISGTKVDEVGFEEIRRQQAALQELRIVVLNNQCISGNAEHDEDETLKEWRQIKSQGLKIVDLDLSQNLFECWTQVVSICGALAESLRTLHLE